MKVHLISLIFVFNSLSILCQDSYPNYTSTMVPADSRYEIVQSNQAVRLTFKIDKYTGDTYQLTEDKKENILFWAKLKRIEHSEDDLSLSNIHKVNYQFFTSGIGIRYTFLISINTGATWQLVIDKNDDYLWEPMY